MRLRSSPVPALTDWAVFLSCPLSKLPSSVFLHSNAHRPSRLVQKLVHQGGSWTVITVTECTKTTSQNHLLDWGGGGGGFGWEGIWVLSRLFSLAKPIHSAASLLLSSACVSVHEPVSCCAGVCVRVCACARVHARITHLKKAFDLFSGTAQVSLHWMSYLVRLFSQLGVCVSYRSLCRFFSSFFFLFYVSMFVSVSACVFVCFAFV